MILTILSVGVPEYLSNTNGWDANVLTFADKELLAICNHFKTPLENAGFTGDSNELLEQWHDMVEYASKYLNTSSTEYHHFQNFQYP